MARFEHFEWIEAYLKGTLSDEEKRAFEQALNYSSDLAQEYEMHLLEWDAMEILIERDLRQQIKIWQSAPVKPAPQDYIDTSAIKKEVGAPSISMEARPPANEMPTEIHKPSISPLLSQFFAKNHPK
jgi:hypothetical protein